MPRITGYISAFEASRAWRERATASDSSNWGEDSGAENLGTDIEDSMVVPEHDCVEPSFSTENAAVTPPMQPLAGSKADLSSWVPSRENAKHGILNSTRIGLKANDRITFVGHYEMLVRSGMVNVYGATLYASNETFQVFAPSTHALPAITCLAGPAEIEIWQTTNSMEEFGRISPLYRNIWNSPKVAKTEYSALLNKSSFSYVQKAGDDPRPLHPLIIPTSWTELFYEAFRKPKVLPAEVLVVGRKDNGKSTFCRVLANCLLTRRASLDATSESELGGSGNVYWLDLDPGQSEFSPAGQISLVQMQHSNLGPPFTHAFLGQSTPNRMIHAHSIGASSPVNDPEYYIECALDLQARYRQLGSSKSRILVINCPGWSSKGFGLELLMQLMNRLSATDIVAIGGTGLPHGVKVFDGIIGDRKLHALGIVATVPASSRTAAELREMQSVSYFHSLDRPASGKTWAFRPLKSQAAWTLSYSAEQPDILAITTQVEHPPSQDYLSAVLDQWLVSICVVEDEDEVDRGMLGIKRTQAEGLPYWPIVRSAPIFRPSIANCRLIGWGFVANVDSERHVLKLKTPISNVMRQSALKKTSGGRPRIVLLRGQTDPPGWAYLQPIFGDLSQRRDQKALVEGGKQDPMADEVQIDTEDLSRGYDINASQKGENEMKYVRMVGRGESTAGQKAWMERPRISRTTAMDRRVRRLQ